MPCYDAVAKSQNQREALLIIAEHIDMIRELIKDKAPKPDPWEAGWVSPGEVLRESFKTEQEVGSRPATVDEVQLAALKSELATTTDGEERRAIEARLRLLEDDGAAVDLNAPEGQRERVEGDDVVLPAPTWERRIERLKFASAHNLREFLSQPMTSEDFSLGYGNGGPLWLYLGDRDAVMAMPFDLRRKLVDEVEKDSPAAAQEMARDVLKATTQESQDFALDTLGSEADDD